MNENKTGLYLRKLADNMLVNAFLEFFQDCGPVLPYCLLVLSDIYAAAASEKKAIRYQKLHNAIQLVITFSELDADIMDDLKALDYILLAAMSQTGFTGSEVFNHNPEAFRRYLPHYFYENLDEAINGEFTINPNATAGEWEQQDTAARLRMVINQARA